MNKHLTLKALKEKYDIVVFDMDGVITSEQNYWDIAALTAYEYLNSVTYFGSRELSASGIYNNLKSIRKELLCDDRVISLCKNIGVNSNWDLAYVTIALRLEFGDGSKCLEYLEKSPDVGTLYESVAQIISKKLSRPLEECRREKAFWLEMVSCYQEWYMGHSEFMKRYQKEPLLSDKPFIGESEKPFLNMKKLIKLLEELKISGVSLGIATGRNDFEIETPLKAWGIYDLFDENRIITYDNVQTGEALMRKKGIEVSFVKPAPYCFLKSALGKDFSDEKIALGEYTVSKRVLAVGDAGADIFAAQNAGFDFLAVLTGINGTDAREFFEKNGATYIDDSLTDILE